MNPVVQRLVSSPCALCGGLEHSHFPHIAMEHAEGDTPWRFELVVCRGCRHVDWFVHTGERFDLSKLERVLRHTVVRATEPAG